MKTTYRAMLISVVCALALTACGPKPTMEMPTEKVNPDDRVQVRRLSVIEDTIAYGDRRGVYLITDTKTGREYIGVSGVGITETGSHDEYSGKYHHQVEDER